MMDKIRKPSFLYLISPLFFLFDFPIIFARVQDMMDKIRKPSGSDRFEKYELQLSQDFELIDETKILKVCVAIVLLMCCYVLLMCC